MPYLLRSARRDGIYSKRYAPPKMKKTRKYKPQYAQSREWSEIENKYLDLIESGLEFEPILNLVKYIRSSGLKDRIYAYTSMHKLVVGH